MYYKTKTRPIKKCPDCGTKYQTDKERCISCARTHEKEKFKAWYLANRKKKNAASRKWMHDNRHQLREKNRMEKMKSGELFRECVNCGDGYEMIHNQKHCPVANCKRIRRNKYLKERLQKIKLANPELIRARAHAHYLRYKAKHSGKSHKEVWNTKQALAETAARLDQYFIHREFLPKPLTPEQEIAKENYWKSKLIN